MADDSAEDRFFVQRALEKSGVGRSFQGVCDGQEAICYLAGEPPFADRTKFAFPNLLLLDLKMPRLNGFEVLEWIRAHPECKVIPTIIFSSSAFESDVHRAYVLGANAYMVKPASSASLVAQIKIIYEFWSACETPAPPPGHRCNPSPASPAVSCTS